MRKIDKDRSQGKSEEKRGKVQIKIFKKSVYSYKYNNRDFRSRKGIS